MWIVERGCQVNYRQVSILRDLISADDFVTSETLASHYSVSTKTIYSDLSVISKEIGELSSKLERVPRRGVRLLIDDGEKGRLGDLIHTFQGEEDDNIPREFVLLKNLFFGDGSIDIVDWSVKYFVSETSVRRDIDKLEARLEPYGFRLEKHHGQIKLSGKEQEIRKFLRNYLITELHLRLPTMADNKHFTYFFSAEEIGQAITVLEHYASSYRFTISEQYSIYLIVDLLIARMRYSKGRMITSNDMSQFIGNLSYYEVFTFAGDLFRDYIDKGSQQSPLLEITNLAYSLLSVGYEPKDIIIGKQINDLVQNLICRVSQLLSIDLRGDEHLAKMLLSHIQPMIFRLKNKILINSDLTEEIKKKYSVLYNIVWLSCRELSDAFAIELTDGEIAFLVVHFEIAIEKLAKPLTIYVVCPQGLATTELIMTSLSYIISSFDHLIKIDATELTEVKVKEADMVISSISLPDMVKDPKIIFISPILTDTDLERLRGQYSQLQKGNRRILSVIEDGEAYTKSLIYKLIGKDVFLNIDKKSVSDCINFLVEKSTQPNQNNQSYYNSIVDRERLGSTSVYTGIALPHALPTAVSQSQLVIMTLKKPIRWGSNMVKVVMLISMSQEDESLYKDALISIYSKIDSADYIDKLWDSKTYEDFLAAL